MTNNLAASKQASKQARLYSLDYLRGICAFGIMIFHYLMFSGIAFDSSHFMARIGFYGVSIFYILSGLTLYTVYQDKDFRNLNVVIKFFRKRLVRIYPLFVLTTILVFFISKKEDFLGLWLNITGLFSILDWSNYFVVGGWSIGNELAFYLTFPILVICAKSKKYVFYLILLISISLCIFFSFFVLDETLPLSSNWYDYTNPLNQWFLFILGIFIAYYFSSIQGDGENVSNIVCVILAIVAIIGFLYYPVDNNSSVALVTDSNRLVFTILSIMLVISFFKFQGSLPRYIHKPLVILGEISYAVYLLHAIVFSIVNKLGKYFAFNVFTVYIVSVAITLVASYISYNYFEKFFMKKVR